jgi:hypothetical protein
MSERAELIAFCERKEGSSDILPAQSYVAGFRRSDGTAAVEITLPPETVERPVLTGARLSLWLALDGRLVLDGEGLSDDLLEAAGAAAQLNEQTLATLVAASLSPEHLAAEDDPVKDLMSLRAQLTAALSQVDSALERLKQR